MDPQADYKDLIDWDGDGSFDHAHSDISAYILSSSWHSGRSNSDPEYDVAGGCNLKLDNSSSIFSSFNTESPLYGLILPNLGVRISMKIGAGSEVAMWQGRLETITPVVGNPVDLSTAELTASGILAQFAEGEVDVSLEENITTGEALGKILNGDNFPAGDRAIDATTLTTLSKWWVRNGSSRLQAMHELQDAEIGRLREGKDGKIVFESRAHIFTAPHDTPQAIYGTGTLNIWNLRQQDPLTGIYNSVRAQARTFNVSENVVLVTVADVANSRGGTPPIVPATVGGVAGTLTVWIEFPTPGSPSGYIAVDQWSTLTPAVDYEANAAADGSGADLTTLVSAVKTAYGSKLRIDFSNSNLVPVHLVVLKAHGTAIVESDPVPLKSDDAGSQAKYRTRQFPYPSLWLTDLVDGQAYCDHLVTRYKDPRPRLIFDVKGNYDDNHLAEVQARKVGDRIRIVASLASFGLGIDSEFIIDSLSHAVDEGRQHIMTVNCTLAPTAQLAAIGTAYTPKTITEPTVSVLYPPDQLQMNVSKTGLKILAAVVAHKYSDGITEAEFRAKHFAPGDEPPLVVDMRTVAEGGTFAHNGTSQLVITGIPATNLGAQYNWTSFAAGRWYIAWRLKNADGWSNWSDGNFSAQKISWFFDTSNPNLNDSGPPSGWSISIKPGAGSTFYVESTRPSIYGTRIKRAIFQIKDNSTGAWRALDANAGAAITRYDGSAISHTYNPLAGTITKPSGNYGDGATYGGLMLVDVRRSSIPPITDVQIVQSTKYVPGSTGNTIVLALGTVPTAGNVLVAFTVYSQYSGARTITGPDGTWTKVDDATQGNDSLAVWTHVVSGGDPSSYTFNISGSNEWRSGVIYELSAVETASIVYAHSIQGSAAANPIIGPNIVNGASSHFTLVCNACDNSVGLNTMLVNGASDAFTIDQMAVPSYHPCFAGHISRSGTFASSSTFALSPGTSVSAAISFNFSYTGTSSWGNKYCQWVIVDPSQFSGTTISDIQGLNLAFAPTGGVYTDVRLKIVKPISAWNTEGYQSLTGYEIQGYGSDASGGDLGSAIFRSNAFPIPTGKTIANMEARLFFANDYSCSDDNTTGTGASPAISLEIPNGIFTDFTDGRYWERHPSKWFSMVPAVDKVSFATNVGARTSAQVGAYAMMSFRPNIVPDANGEIEIRVRVKNLVRGSATSTVSVIFGLVKYVKGGDFVVWGLNGIGDSNNILQIFENYCTNQEQSTVSGYVSSVNVTALQTLDLKWAMDPGDPNNANTFGLWSQSRSIDGAAYSAVSYGGSPPTLTTKRSFGDGTTKFGVIVFSTTIDPSISADVCDFQVVKGIVSLPADMAVQQPSAPGSINVGQQSSIQIYTLRSA